MMRDVARREPSPLGSRTGAARAAGSHRGAAPSATSLPPIPFQEIQERAAQVAEAIARRWLPNGQRNGGWWVCNVPWREDKHPSFGLSLSTGRWKDFAGGEKGDVIDLYQRLYGGTKVDAAKAVARVIGHPFGDEA